MQHVAWLRTIRRGAGVLLLALPLPVNAQWTEVSTDYVCQNGEQIRVYKPDYCLAPLPLPNPRCSGCKPGSPYSVSCGGGGLGGGFDYGPPVRGPYCGITCSTVTETESPCGQVDPELPGCPTGNCPKPPGEAGKPVSLTTGEMYFTHADASTGELQLQRTFNSGRAANVNRYGVFGPGWNASFEKRLRIAGNRVIEFRNERGDPSYYGDLPGNGTYEPRLPFHADSRVEAVLGGFQHIYRSGAVEVYAEDGRLLSETDPSGTTTTYGYDGDRVATVTRRGRTLTIVYGDDGRPQRVETASGIRAVYAYSGSRLDRVDYADGTGYRYGYDAAGRVVWVRDAQGHPVEGHEYDASGRALTSEIGGGREKLVFSYGSNQTTVTDSLGNSTIYRWKVVRGLRQVWKIEGPCSGCGGGGDVQEWTHDAKLGPVTAYKDGAGQTWSYSYDPVTLDKLSETDPLSRVTSYSYDAAGRVLSVASPGGGLTSYTHGPAGPLSITEAVTASVSRTTAFAYGAHGKPVSVTDPRGKTTTFAYDGTTHDLLSVTDPMGHTTSFGYDAEGRRTTVTDALGHSTTTEYDSGGRVTKITSHDGTFTRFEYDASGHRTAVIDPAGKVTRYSYDPYERLTAVTDPANGVTRYGYDLMSRLTSLTDAKGQKTTFEYDGHARLVKTTYPGGAFETFTYDPAGRLSTKTDRKGVVTTYAYDVLGRLTGKSYSDGTTPPVAYTYDTAGRLATAANGTDTLTWTYDLAGQMLSEQSAKNASVVSYTYDAAGNRLTLSLDGQLFTSYAYDDASRLTSITRGTQVFGFAYDAANRRTTMTYPNGVTTSYTYDQLNRLLRIKADHVPSGNPITDFQYTYDAAGNRTQKAQLDYTEDYAYDDLYRLVGVKRSAGLQTGGLTGSWRYVYDPVGNRLVEQHDDAVTTYSYNERNQLLQTVAGGTMRWRGVLDEPGSVSFTSATVNGQPARMLQGNVFEADLPMAPGTNAVTLVATDMSGNQTTKNYTVEVSGTNATYTYDPNGNMTSDGSKTYVWDAENRLVEVKQGENTLATFGYDGRGRRVEKAAGGVTRSYVLDGVHVAEERLSGGATGTMRYVLGLDIDEWLGRQNANGSTTYFTADHLGSITNETSSTGTVTLARSYDAWGNLDTAGAGINGFAYTGRDWDSEADLYYHRARYYEARIGRFASEDPVATIDRTQPELNAYAYARSNPISYVDRDGRTAAGAGGGFVVGVWWARRCAKEAIANASLLFPPPSKGGATNFDKQKHCYVACHVTRCLGFGPGMVVAIVGQVLWEAMSGGIGWQGWTSADPQEDTKAATWGAGQAFMPGWCQNHCKTCPY